MADLEDLTHILRVYTRKKNSPYISFQDVRKYSALWAEELKKTKPGFTDFSAWTPDEMAVLLEKMEERQICQLSDDSRNNRVVTFLEFFLPMVLKYYESMESDPERPFPTEDYFKISFPDVLILPVEVKETFSDYLTEKETGREKLLRLNFPDGIRGILLPRILVTGKLQDLCMSKIRNYLTISKNADYSFQRLNGLFPNRDKVLKGLIGNIMTQREVAITTLKNPDEFTFQFWSYFLSMIIKEFREKKDKLEREHSFCQAAYLLGYYSNYYKGTKRQKQEKENTLKSIESSLKRAPHYFTFSDITMFKDKSGYPVTKKITQEELIRFMEKQCEPADGSTLPALIRVRTADKKEYYVAKEEYLLMTLRKLQEVSREIRKSFVEEWAELMGDFKKCPEMVNDDRFLRETEKRLHDGFPFLSGLLKFETMAVILEEVKPPNEIRIETERLFRKDMKGFIPYDEMFRLNRKAMIHEARVVVPLWKSIPVIGRVVVFLNHLFDMLEKKPGVRKKHGRKKADEGEEEQVDAKFESIRTPPGQEGFKKISSSDAERNSAPDKGSKKTGKSAVDRKIAFKKALMSLQEEYIGKGKNLDTELSKLSEEWNIVVDRQAKLNLVEDVNSMIRDYMRKIRRLFAVKLPERGRIRNLAEELAKNESFDKIRNKESFILYIELYMIKLLGGK